MSNINSDDEIFVTRKSKRNRSNLNGIISGGNKRAKEQLNQESECSIRTASGKTISPALLAKLKNQIADNEKAKKENEQKEERVPRRKPRAKRITMREMYFKDGGLTKEEEKQQCDVETYALLKQALQNRLYDVILNWNLFTPAQSLPILPSSFRNVEEYIRMYLNFILQEMQAQAIKSLNPKNRKRCSIVQCSYDSSENECMLYMDSSELNTKLINTYSILVPYVNLPDETNDKTEFSFENAVPSFHLPFFFGIVNSQSGMNNAPYRVKCDVFQLATRFPALFHTLDKATNITCSVYPLVQLSTTLREWTSLLLLHYCVYDESDTRSLQWTAEPVDNTLLITTPSKISHTPSGSFITQFYRQTLPNPAVSFINKSVNDSVYQEIYPPAFQNFRLPLNPLLRDVVCINPQTYRFVYAGENASFLQDMNVNPNSYYVSGTSPNSPLTGQFPWVGCSPEFITYLRENYNRSQLFAVESCLYQTQKQTPSARPVSSFTLIQGPPGTGKTRTLLMLLNVLQNQQFDRYYEQLRTFVNSVIFTNKRGFINSLDEVNKARIQMKEKLVKPRILVCTPSNAAVNTIIDNIISKGFIDNSGKK